MPKCWNCGAEAHEQASFCPICGKSLAVSSGSLKSTLPYGQSQPNPNQPYPINSNYQMQESRLERKIENLQKIVIAILVLQIIFLILLFA